MVLGPGTGQRRAGTQHPFNEHGSDMRQEAERWTEVTDVTSGDSAKAASGGLVKAMGGLCAAHGASCPPTTWLGRTEPALPLSQAAPGR